MAIFTYSTLISHLAKLTLAAACIFLNLSDMFFPCNQIPTAGDVFLGLDTTQIGHDGDLLSPHVKSLNLRQKLPVGIPD